MDDKTFIANFAANETQRINDKMKEVFFEGQQPNQQECDAVIADIEQTLVRIKSALLHAAPEYFEDELDALDLDDEDDDDITQ